jgi:hypothetical protein
MNNSFTRKSLVAAALVLCLSMTLMADTIRLKDGSVIRGQVIGFKDQQFVVLVGTGSRGRRSQITLYMEDVESIEFDANTDTTTASNTNTGNDPFGNTGTSNNRPQTRPNPPRTNPTTSDPDSTADTTQPSNRPTSNTSTSSPTFFQVNTRVRGDATTNGWTNTGLVVRRGQRLRLNATGRVVLGAGRASTPAGVATLRDPRKLMPNEATGALIAVIGDDNDEFILIGNRREFTAQRDGVLFLGVNEETLSDNTGAYDVVIEAEAIR